MAVLCHPQSSLVPQVVHWRLGAEGVRRLAAAATTPERILRKAVGLQTMLAHISGVGCHPVLVPECLGGSWDSGGLEGVLRAVTQSGDLGERGVN